MPNYTKLFNSIVTSTIWTEDDKTRIVWITMLALADQNGEVHASIPGLARLAGVPLSDVESAITKFLNPDQYSRTPTNEGRRIAAIDGGWELLNHAKYRRMASLADQKDANAKRQKRHRDRNATVTHSNGSVTGSNATVTVETDKAEAEADSKAEVSNTKRVAPAPSRFVKPSPQEVAEYGATLNPPFTKSAEFADFYDSKGWKVGQTPMKDWRAAVRTWHRKDTTPELKIYSHPNSYDESTELP